MDASLALVVPLDSYIPPMVPDPGILGGFALWAGLGIVFYLGLFALVILATYWLIRLAVRHGGMDVARWQRAGMPARMPKKYTPPRSSDGSYFQR